MKRKLYLASPSEPSGASWLINCFLELGIQVSHKPVVDNVWRHADPVPPPDRMWQRTADGSHRLHPKAQVLKKWLPALSRIESFSFRADIEIEYLQDLPTSREVGQPVILFVRDPRDSLYSMYCRVRPALDYDTFLRLPNPDTLYDRPMHWRLFVESWLPLAGENWFTFESYKRDAAALLQRVVERMRVPCDDRLIERAVVESSFEKARAAEQRYRTLFPGDWEVANRSGRPGDWAEHTEGKSGSALIQSRAADVMRRLGYDCVAHTDGISSYSPELMRRLPIFSRISLPESVASLHAGESAEDPWLDAALAFAAELDEGLLRRTNLANHRIRQLLDSLASVAPPDGWDSAAHISQVREGFAEGSEYQLAQVQDLLVRRRRAKP